MNPMIKTVLWDMDGVLADVSLSYRAAITETAKHFGADISSDDIEKQKLLGNANNDWQLTFRLIQACKNRIAQSASSMPTLEEVTEKFEELYQGTQDKKGLYLLETLLVPKALIQEIHRRLPCGMAIVTGRPKKDCEAFLKRFDLADLFKVCICMEDCEPKPSPKPLLLALHALKVRAEEAAMLGDTVDDMVASRDAHVLALGVLTPQAYAKAILSRDQTESEAFLIASGAKMVLKPGLAELLELATQEISHESSNSKRKTSVSRVTKETKIHVSLFLDGTGRSNIDTGIGFLDHMITTLAKHSRFDIDLNCKGDIYIDDHHTTEDCALAIGEAFDKALGSRAGIARFGTACVPLDEALSRAVVDISSRPHSEINLSLTRPTIGTLSCEMIPHFFHSFASAARITLHIDILRGSNDHHRAEASFKALAVAIRNAIQFDPTAGIPSTKEMLA